MDSFFFSAILTASVYHKFSKTFNKSTYFGCNQEYTNFVYRSLVESLKSNSAKEIKILSHVYVTHRYRNFLSQRSVGVRSRRNWEMTETVCGRNRVTNRAQIEQRKREEGTNCANEVYEKRKTPVKISRVRINGSLCTLLSRHYGNSLMPSAEPEQPAIPPRESLGFGHLDTR